MSVTFEHHQRKEKVGYVTALIEIKTNFKRDEYINKAHRIVFMSTLPFNILILPMEVVGGGGEVPKRMAWRCSRLVPLKPSRIWFLSVCPTPPQTHSSQPEIPLTEESFFIGVMAKTEYLGNARGLTLHGGVNGMHLILSPGRARGQRSWE